LAERCCFKVVVWRFNLVSINHIIAVSEDRFADVY
jgi:hypothetical protein